MEGKVKADAATSCTAAIATAATITVGDSGGAMYTKIQYAVDNATAGDTIGVASGKDHACKKTIEVLV